MHLRNHWKAWRRCGRLMIESEQRVVGTDWSWGHELAAALVLGVILIVQTGWDLTGDDEPISELIL